MTETMMNPAGFDIHHAERRTRAWYLPALRPILEPGLARLVGSSPELLLAAADRYGSPVNIVWPDVLERNVEKLSRPLLERGLDFEIYYGAKVNKSWALVRAAIDAGIGVDVSSRFELADALRCGATSSDLCASGPSKTPDFHRGLLDCDALISIDSLEEMAAVAHILDGRSGTARVLLRYRPTSAAASRFGMSGDELSHGLRGLAAQGDRFRFEGFHFPLGGYGHATRADAIGELAPLVDQARDLGLSPRLIDIGGGLPVRYVASADYDAYVDAQSDRHYRNGSVPRSFYPYGGRIDAAEWLEFLLDSPCRHGLSVAEWLRAEGLIFAMEPGRGLADQAAISLFRINLVKALPGGQHAIFVEGSSFSACETWFSSEFLVDPIHIARDCDGMAASLPMRAFIAGHSCLDEDVLSNRLIDFPKAPRPGDLLLFANTGGYQMDLLENEFHRHPRPRRIAASCDASGAVTFTPDDLAE